MPNTLAWIDDALRVVIEERSLPARLAEAVRYAALGPGKRVRPMLVRRCAVAVGGDGDTTAVSRAAAAVELVHAFSLVHDDLPAMDDDDLRRGRPTLHRQFDDATAVLAGDVMQSLAWELLAEIDAACPQPGGLSTELAGATTDMIAGQVFDTLGGQETAGDTDADRLRTVHRFKTGALLRASCRIGAKLGGATEDQLEHLTRFANALGLLFQAVDDLLDVTSDAATLGKATQKDADAGKLTYPGVFGVDGTRGEIRQLHETARSALETFGPSAEPLRELADRLATRDR